MSLSSHRRVTARGPQNIVGGIFLMLIAALALYLVKDLPAAGRVGFASGTAPRLFAYGLLGLGAVVMIEGFLKEGLALETFPWRAPVAILGAVLFFGLTIRYLGLFATGLPMMLLASAAAPGFRPTEAAIFSILITVFCGLLFVYTLGQPIPLWPNL